MPKSASRRGTQAQGRRSSLTRSRIRAAWLFIAPSLVVLALIAGWPLVRTIWFSFTDADLNNLNDYDFIGFENYLANYDGEWLGLLTEPDWWHSVWNTVWFTLVSVSLETVLGIVVALILNAAFPGRGLMRAVVLIPWAIPTVVSAKMWNWMLHDQFGVINDMLLRIGLIAAPITWTANPDTALWAAVMVDVWKTHLLHGAPHPGGPADAAAGHLRGGESRWRHRRSASSSA